MRRCEVRSLALLPILFLLAGCGALRPAAAPETAVVQGDLGARLDRSLSGVPAGVLSATVLVAKDGEVALHKSYGPVTLRTIFPIASISKQFTAAAILKLAEQGRLSPEDPAGRFLAGMPEDKRGITIHQLLTHTAGLPREVVEDGEVLTRDEVVRRALGSKLLAEPGTRHAYSNAGYMLLAAIVEAASGKEFEAFLEDHLFRPAGMEATGFPGPEWDRKAVAPGEGREGEPYSGTPLDEPASRGWYRRGAGGLLSTAEDLYRWARALEKGTVLSRASVRKLFTPHVPESEDGASFYGYGWVVDKTTRGTKVNWHNGGWYSYYSELRLYPDEGVIAVLTANRRGEALEEAWFGMLRTLFSPPPSTMANRE